MNTISEYFCRQAVKLPKRFSDLTRITKLRAYLESRGSQNAVFIWVPKTAGTSLHKVLNIPKLKTLKLVQNQFAGRGVITFGHMDYQQLVVTGSVSTHFDTTSFKFAFVRNPYDRAVSLYHYLHKKQAIPRETSFLQFCEKLAEDGCEPIGLFNSKGLSQCNPQVRWIEKVDLDFLGKMENFDSDAQKVLSVLGMPHAKLPRLNRSTNMDYRMQYEAESKAIIESFYREDFDAFGYPIDL